MNNSEIGAAFVAMCNGTQEKRNVNGRNNLSITTDGKNVTLWSYNTAIAYYHAETHTAIVSTYFYSPSTAKHQSAVKGSGLYACRVRFVNFTEWNASGADLLKFDVPTRYRLSGKYTVTTANGRHVTRQDVIDSVETWDYYHSRKSERHIYSGITPARATRLVEELNWAERPQ